MKSIHMNTKLFQERHSVASYNVAKSELEHLHVPLTACLNFSGDYQGAKSTARVALILDIEGIINTGYRRDYDRNISYHISAHL